MYTFNELLLQLGLHPDFCSEIAKHHLYKSCKRRLTCFHNVIAILATCNKRAVSINQLAACISLQFKMVVFRQAIHKAIKI
jgi:hypothetical protein